MVSSVVGVDVRVSEPRRINGACTYIAIAIEE